MCMVSHLQYQIQLLEKVQRQFVTNDFSCCSSVTSMLDHLQWPLLEQRRCFSKLIMFYKILHGLVDINLVLTPLPVDVPSRTRIGHPIHVWAFFLSHMRMGILYTYRAPYAYGYLSFHNDPWGTSKNIRNNYFWRHLRRAHVHTTLGF